MITLKELTKIYQAGEVSVRAVDGVNFDVAEGDMVMIVGRSGSGKTTLLSLIGGLTRPTSGSVSIAGVEMAILNIKSYRSSATRILALSSNLPA